MTKKAETVLYNSKTAVSLVPIVRDLLTKCNLPNNDSKVKELISSILNMLGHSLPSDHNSKANKEMIIMLVSPESKKKWDSMKNYPDESYEDMFNHFVRIVEEEEEDLTEEDWTNIERSIKEIKKGKLIPHEQLKKCLNTSLVQ